MKTVLVIFGGQSTEHDISIITAINSIIKPLEMTKKFSVVPLYIAKNGNWYYHPRLKDLALYQSGQIDKFLSKIETVKIGFNRGLNIFYRNKIKNQKIKVDLVFPALHGTKGEDGALMGLLEMANVAFVGCDMSSSAIAMNKVLSKQLAQVNQINTSKFMWFKKADLASQSLEKIAQKVKAQLKFPLFVKPAHLGSSIGISRVKELPDLINAIELAFYYDDLVLVEEEVPNLIEVTLPIIGNQQPQPAYLERPLLKAGDFFDFNTKYLSGGKKSGGQKTDQNSQGYSEIPAKLDKKLYQQAEDLGVKVFKVFSLSGIARVDMLIDAKLQKVYFNEINPLPGSLYAHNFQKFGISNIDLVIKLIDLAFDKFQDSQAIQKVFSTNYLKQF